MTTIQPKYCAFFNYSSSCSIWWRFVTSETKIIGGSGISISLVFVLNENIYFSLKLITFLFSLLFLLIFFLIYRGKHMLNVYFVLLCMFNSFISLSLAISIQILFQYINWASMTEISFWCVWILIKFSTTACMSKEIDADSFN